MNIFSKEFLMAVAQNGIADVQCSSNTTWVLLKNGDLYGCGYNYYGQQGSGTSGNGTHVTTFTKRASNVSRVACSSNSTWYLTTSGDLYGCGSNGYGQQGSGNTTNVTTFTQRASNVAQIACSSATTWYITTSGDLYGCGSGVPQGSGGTSDVKSFTKRASNVAQIACSSATTWYITTSGGLYGCGWNSRGQQGSGDTTEVKTFTKRASNVSQVLSGDDSSNNGTSTAYLTTSKELYSCGKESNTNVFTQIASNVEKFGGSPSYIWYIDANNDLYGHVYGSGSSSSRPKIASGVAYAVASQWTTWYITTSGDLYGCGSNGNGQQGSGDTTNVTTFTKRASNVSRVACSYSGDMTWYITNNGDLYGCGNNYYGQQGNGSTDNVLTFENKMPYLT